MLAFHFWTKYSNRQLTRREGLLNLALPRPPSLATWLCCFRPEMAQYITVADRWQKKTFQLNSVIKGRERPGAGILIVSSRTPLPPKTYSSQPRFLKVSPSSFRGCGPSFSTWAFGKIFQSQTITPALSCCLRIFTSKMAK